MKKSTIPTIIGVIVLVFALAAGVLLVKNQQIFRLGASPEASPKDVRITNISDSSFTVSWVTDKETQGFVKWGKTVSVLDQTELDEISGQSVTHSVTIRTLSPQTQYLFKISSGGTEFDNGGTPWQTKTGPAIDSPAKSNLISGSVLTQTGTPAKGALVYFTVGGGSLLSVVSSQNGSWVIPISSARTQDLTSFVSIDETTTLVEIAVNAGPDGVASAQIYPQSAKPAPAIILGQTHDFKNLAPSATSEIPKATIGLPENATPSSGFEVNQPASTPSAKNVTLKSLNEGEVVTSTKPEFFGDGPAKTAITITVESDPITQTVNTSPTGSWKWSPPTNLPEGIHKITITWKDASGILRTLTRTFVVQAAEGPAFTSTPSATPSPSATPTPTLTTTPTPTPTSTPTPTRVSTSSPIPVSGSLTPTIALFIMGIGVLLFSFMVWKKSDA